MNNDIHVGMMKAVGYGMAFRQHDPAERDEHDTSDILPRHLVRAVWTAFTLQLCVLFEEGLDAYLAAKHPGWRATKRPGKERPAALGTRIWFLKQKHEVSNEADVQWLVDRRNALAHKRSAFATYDDWRRAWWTIKTELGNLGVVPKKDR